MNVTTLRIHGPNNSNHRRYRHHSNVDYFNNRVYASFSLHKTGEDGPGQYILGVKSDDEGQSWNQFRELFPRCDDETLPRTSNGLALYAGEYTQVPDGRIFATGHCAKGIGFNGGRQRQGYDSIARDVTDWDNFGPIFWCGPNHWTPKAGYPVWPDGDPADVQLLLDYWSRPENTPSFGWGIATPKHNAVIDGVGMGEGSAIIRDDGTVYRFWRAGPFVYQTLHNGTEEHITRLLLGNEPARTYACKLTDGRVVLAGNLFYKEQRNPLHLAVSEDDGDSFKRVETIISGIGPTPVYSSPNDGRGGGDQYPSLVQAGNTLVCICSRHKESIYAHLIDVNSI